MDDKDFTKPYIIDKVPNPRAVNQLTTQAKNNVCTIDINREECITEKGSLYELQRYQTQPIKSKVNISLLPSKIYLNTYLEELWTIFDQIRPVVSHIQVCLP